MTDTNIISLGTLLQPNTTILSYSVNMNIIPDYYKDLTIEQIEGLIRELTSALNRKRQEARPYENENGTYDI